MLKIFPELELGVSCVNVFYVSNKFHARYRRVELRNEFHFSGVHGAMNRSGSRAK